ncbi:MAG: hypothetical protein ABIJ61_10025, partial [bacterium]
ISVWYNTKKQATISGINVLAGPMTAFSVTAPPTATAGEPFAVVVSEAVDAFDNPVAGIARVELLGGNGASPSGSLPSLDDFSVSGGQGSGTVTLVAAQVTEITVSVDSLTETLSVAVVPADLERFQFELAGRQVPGQTFRAPAQLTAYDSYGNLVSGFDAAADLVTITSSGSGEVTHPLINTATAFSEGVCDLRSLGVGYQGDELTVGFTATSSTGKSGVSPLVEFSRVLFTAGGIDSDSLFVGEEFTISLTVTNYGTQSLTVESLELSANEIPFTDFDISPSLPGEIVGGSNQTYLLTGTTSTLSPGSIEWSATFSGVLGGGPISGDLERFASLTILGQEGVSVLPESFEPHQVSVGRQYTFSVEVVNDNLSDLKLTRETRLYFGIEGYAPWEYFLQSAVLVPSGDTVTIRFGPLTVPDGLLHPLGNHAITLIGTIGEVAYEQAFSFAQPFQVQTLPDISYVLESIAPGIIYRSRAVEFDLAVMNGGSATLDNADAQLDLFAGAQMLTAVAGGTSGLSLPPGETQLAFGALFVPNDFPTDLDSMILTVQGDANEYDEHYRLNLPVDELTIPSGPAVAVTQVTNSAPNAPRVNLGQRFELSATVVNQGDEDLRDIKLHLGSDGSSTFTGPLTVPFLSLSAETTVVFNVDAALQSTSSEIFTISLLSATGVSSGLAAELLPPTSYNQFAVIQRPANLSLSATITAPQDALDGLIKPGVEFTITALVENSGQAEVGAGELSLSIIAGGFTSNDPLTQGFTLNQPVSWRITAPVQPDSGDFEIEITQVPTDFNVQLPARITQGSASLGMLVRETEVEISVDFQALATPVISAGSSYNVLDFSFEILGDEKPYLKYLDIWLLDRRGEIIPPSEIVAAAKLEFNGAAEITGSVSAETGAMRFLLGSEFGTPTDASVNLTIADNPAHQDFVLHLDSTSFSAAYQSAAGEKTVPVKAAFATRLVIEQSFTLVSGQLAEAFFCYPNPFSPERQSLTFTNPMPEKSKTLAIFTLTGEEVYRVDLGVDAGAEILWDGRNQSGQMVLNGVYLAVLTIPGENEIRTKVAVVK